VSGKLDYPHDLSHDLSEGLFIYPLLLFVVMTNKEQSHHRITGCWLQGP
jgi:hypothetical protein